MNWLPWIICLAITAKGDLDRYFFHRELLGGNSLPWWIFTYKNRQDNPESAIFIGGKDYYHFAWLHLVIFIIFSSSNKTTKLKQKHKQTKEKPIIFFESYPGKSKSKLDGNLNHLNQMIDKILTNLVCAESFKQWNKYLSSKLARKWTSHSKEKKKQQIKNGKSDLFSWF